MEFAKGLLKSQKTFTLRLFGVVPDRLYLCTRVVVLVITSTIFMFLGGLYKYNEDKWMWNKSKSFSGRNGQRRGSHRQADKDQEAVVGVAQKVRT